MRDYDKLVRSTITTIAADHPGDYPSTLAAIKSFAHTLVAEAQTQRYIDYIKHPYTAGAHGPFIEATLTDIGLSPRYKGWWYMLTIVAMTIDNDSLLTDVGKNIYEPVATMYGVHNYNIFQCVSKLIAVCQRQRTLTWQRLFIAQPSPVEFILTITKEVRKHENIQA